MMGLEVHPFDPAVHLVGDEDILAYLQAAVEGNDPRHIALALGDVARAKGMGDMAQALSGYDNPTLETLIALLTDLGLELAVQKKRL